MTIINIVEPSARDVELGIDVVDESSNHQDTEELGLVLDLELDNLFLGLVSNDNDEEEVQQQQPSSVSFNEEEIEQQPSSSPNDNEDEEDIPPRPPPPNWFFPTDEPITFDRHNCPMILKPFAWLFEILVVIILTVFFYGVVFNILLVVDVFFLPILFMYKATVLARESNILEKKYINEGVSADGVVVRRYSTWESGGSDGPPVLVEHALVSYEYGNDEYLMKLSPLREKVKDSIGSQDTMPILLLPNSPQSGIPEVSVANLSWSCLSRILLFTFGLALSAVWTSIPCLFLYADNDNPDWRILVAIVLLVGILPIALFFFWKGFRDRLVSLNLPPMTLKLIEDVEVRKIRPNSMLERALMAVTSQNQS